MIHIKKTDLSIATSRLVRLSACIGAAGTLAAGCAGSDENGRREPATFRQGPVAQVAAESFDVEERFAALSPDMFQALQRDLGLSRSQVLERHARVSGAKPVAEQLQEELGDAFGGAWMTDDGERLVIGVTDAAPAKGRCSEMSGAWSRPKHVPILATRAARSSLAPWRSERCHPVKGTVLRTRAGRRSMNPSSCP